jgi:putative membrane protein
MVERNEGWASPNSDFDPFQITRPDSALLKYYFLVSLLSGPAFPLALIPLLFKYETLRYRFDESGVSMSWGFLFRRETYLTYRRIQDIHLTRNLLQRWMGLATVSVQTASGSATPEMSIEGVLAADQLRDFLYSQMRGAKGEAAATATDATPETAARAAGEDDEALTLLREIRDELRRLPAAGGPS